MVVPDVEQAKRRLQDILRRAQKLEIPTQEVISTRTARKLLARTRNILTWTIWISVFVILLSGVVYARWPTRPTRQDVETVRTVLRRTQARTGLLQCGTAFNAMRLNVPVQLRAIFRNEWRRFYNLPRPKMTASSAFYMRV
ncbi:uncharacterized protein LOC105284108 isoform X2 [Ooceraea biroi]|uniref:uncharacterized protein LOC105284108 isoform X2 n=1 Tax=Ooceraea biroi TaxID=2015173 RepID=UPI0005BDDAED|nr:uncharacterized protein LOC105284108 isoform X2 [Ooceraea biroi]